VWRSWALALLILCRSPGNVGGSGSSPKRGRSQHPPSKIYEAFEERIQLSFRRSAAPNRVGFQNRHDMNPPLGPPSLCRTETLLTYVRSQRRRNINDRCSRLLPRLHGPTGQERARDRGPETSRPSLCRCEGIRPRRRVSRGETGKGADAL
jgi:hypothetical protein